MRSFPRLILLAVFFSGALAGSLAAQDSTRLIIAFNKAKPGLYEGSWTRDAVVRSKQGLFVANDATGAGKIGEGGLTWDFSKDSFLELTVAIGPANEMGGFGLVLIDGDGTELRWALPLGDLQPGSPKAMKLRFNEAIATSVAGTTPGFDRAAVTGWRFEGDGVSTTTAQLVFIALGAGH